MMEAKKKIIIGFGYKARSGKDTGAEYLVRKYGFTRFGFADTLKESCRAVFGFNDDQLYGNLKETIDPFWNKTPREYLQKIGDGFRNLIDPQIWLKAIERKILSTDTHIVVPDIRYKNEINFIRNKGGIVVKIKRDYYELKDTQATHTSEVELDGYKEWDYELDNNGTKEDFYKKIDIIIKEQIAK